jgi:hypothetical protein
MAKKPLLLVLGILAGLALAPDARSADEPDSIFKRSTVFKWLSPNDKLAVYAYFESVVRSSCKKMQIVRVGAT